MRRHHRPVLASGFGAGYSPIAPGTAGTLVAVPLAWVWSWLPPAAHIALLLACLPFGAIVCGRAARQDDRLDPEWVVFDEMVGYWVAVAFVPPGWAAFGAGFVLFRLFDILKPPPIRWLDQNIRGGWGILLDDVAAGIYARCALVIAQRLGAM